MPTDADFDALNDETPEPSSWKLGFPWHEQFNVESSNNPNFGMGVQRIGRSKSDLHGAVKVDGFTSIQKNIAGPLVQHDAPTGIIPSTLFTPFPRDILGVDLDYFEVLAIVAMAGIFGAVVNGLTDAE